ncbi:MAG: glycerate kinase [Alistipes sp.]|nr:glycerate kinase [Alistipes sp.]
MKRITVAVDSFKGSLSSREVAEAVEQGIVAVLPDCEVRKVSIADGGEGTVEAMVENLSGEWAEVEVRDPLMRPIKVRYGVVDDGRTAVMEMSAASGLPLLAVGERNPLKTTTYGTGQMIADAVKSGARRLLIGIGGSATNDAGVGMLAALGFRFYDIEDEPLSGGGEILQRIARIDGEGVMPQLAECEFVVACDVKNPLYGESGAAYVFAPQKGADEAMVQELDKGLRNFARVVADYCGEDLSSLPGAGAAGGLGFAFKALLGAELRPGIEMVLDAIDFASIIEGSDLVITGEGKIDRQTVMGKAPSGVLRVAQSQEIPTVAIGGAVEMCEELAESDFVAILPIVSGPIELSEAMRKDVAHRNIRRTVEQIIRLLNLKQKSC